MKVKEVDITEKKSILQRIIDYRDNMTYDSKSYMPPETLGKPKGVDLALDSCLRDVIQHQTNALTDYVFPRFLGYALLSNLQQEGLIRACVETVADDLTRKFITVVQDARSDEDILDDVIDDLNKDLDQFKIKAKFHEAYMQCGFMGGCLGYLDFGEITPEEAMTPLVIDEKLIKKGSFRGIKIIEPINVYPCRYNSTDPTRDDYFVPESWYIMGREYHASRFLYFADNIPPQLLRPAYNFFGIPKSQLCLDYINHFTKNRESAQKLLEKFSLTAWKTDMSQFLSGGSASDIVNRAKFFNKMRNNDGVMLLDKESEDMFQLNTPLSGVTDIVQMSLDLLTTASHQPDVKLFGKNPKGLGGSDAEAIRIYYDYVLGLAEKLFRDNLEKIIKILQINRYGKVHNEIGFKFNPLWEMSDKEIADLNKVKADTDAINVELGVISPEEVRQRLAGDPMSGYSNIDGDIEIEQPEEKDEAESDKTE